MNMPFDILSKYVCGPIHRLRIKYFSRSALYNCCNTMANFIFEKSKDLPVVMIALNSLSLLSSHLAQINALKKSNRENKDYLINQERAELGLDLIFTTVFPSMINNALRKKLEGGQFTTRMTEYNLKNVVAPAAGVTEKELCDTSHILPFWKSVKSSINSLGLAVKKKMKSKPKELWKILNFKEPDLNKAVPTVSLFDIAVDADASKRSGFKNLYNGRAFDDMVGAVNGTLIITTILYLIVVSNMLMPIIKNLLANRAYKKQLEKAGETPESIKRKMKYASLRTDISLNDNNKIFSEFLNNNPVKSDNISNVSYKKANFNAPKNNIFKDFKNYNSNLRI